MAFAVKVPLVPASLLIELCVLFGTGTTDTLAPLDLSPAPNADDCGFASGRLETCNISQFGLFGAATWLTGDKAAWVAEFFPNAASYMF